MDNPVVADLQFPDNTGPIVQGFQALSSLSRQFRDDIQAANDDLSTTQDRAENLRSSFQQALEILEQMRDVAHEINNQLQLNSTELGQQILQMNQMVQSAKNIQQPFGATGQLQGGMPGAVGDGFGNPLGYQMQMAQYQNAMRMMNDDPFYGASGKGLKSQFVDANTPSFFEGREDILPTEGELGGGAGGHGGGHGGGDIGGGGGGGRTPPPDMPNFDTINVNTINVLGAFNLPPGFTMGGYGGYGAGIPYDEYSEEFKEGAGGPISRPEFPATLPTVTVEELKNDGLGYNPSADLTQNAPKEQTQVQSIADNFPGSSVFLQGLKDQNINQAPYYALNNALGVGNQIFGNIPILNSIWGIASNYMGSIANRASIAANTGAPVNDLGLNKFEQTMMNFTNKFGNLLSGQTGNSLLNTVGSTVANIGGMAAQISAVYNGVKAVGNEVRSQAYNAQTLGDIYGTVGYMRYADYRARALGYRPQDKAIYGTQDALASIYAATQLGLKGSAVPDYQNIDYTMQTRYGLSHGETQQLLSTGLAYGMNLDTLSTGLGQARQYASNTNTSMAYVNQSYQQGAALSASIGLNSSAAAYMGNQAVKFGAGNYVGQYAGMTGQELVGTQLGTALFAQAAGTSFMNVYAATQNMSGAQAGKYESMANLKVLQMLGINPNSIQSQNDLNKYAMLLGIALPQMGIADVSTPQQAVTWAWLVIQQARQMGVIGSGVSGATSTKPGSKQSGNAQTGPSQGMTGYTGSSQTIASQMSNLAANGDTSVLSTAINSAGYSNSTSSTTSNGVNVSITLTPAAAAALSASISSASNATSSPSARLNQGN